MNSCLYRYGGNTTASQPHDFQFPRGFCISQNPKHWSNEQETLKLIDEVVNSYVVKKRTELNLAETQKALMVWDAFKGHKTEAVKQKLTSHDIELVTVPANMTHFFQPWDVTVNGAAKRYMKKEFAVYYSSSVKQQLDSGKKLEDIDVDFRLTALHAQWLVNLFNFFTSRKGAELIMKGWKKAGIVGVLDGSIVLPSEDPFSEFFWTLCHVSCYSRSCHSCEYYIMSVTHALVLFECCVSWIIVWGAKLLKLIPAKSTILKIC